MRESDDRRAKLPTIRDIPGNQDREELAKFVRHAVAEFESITTTDARAWGLEAAAALADLIAAAVPLADSAMAVAVLGGATNLEVADRTGISSQQVSRRIASAAELEQYAEEGNRSTLRVTRDGLSAARQDLAAGSLKYGNGQETEWRRK